MTDHSAPRTAPSAPQSAVRPQGGTYASTGDRWAVYVRSPRADESALMGDVRSLISLVAARGGTVAGVYADMGASPGPEARIMLGHAYRDRLDRLALIEAGALAADRQALAGMLADLHDVGVRLTVLQFAGQSSAAGFDLDAVPHQLIAEVRRLAAGDT